MGWNSVVYQAAIRVAKIEDDQRVVYLKDLNDSLPYIVEKSKSNAKDPGASLRAVVQNLEKYGLLHMPASRRGGKKTFPGEKGGKYTLLPFKFSVEALLDRSKMSMGEKIVAEVLKDLGIDFIREKKFPDLKDRSYLRIDFYFKIKDEKFYVEFDGKQHREPVKHYGGQGAFEKTQRRDKIKTEYCERTGTLIRCSVPNYWDILDRVTLAVAEKFGIPKKAVPAFIRKFAETLL